MLARFGLVVEGELGRGASGVVYLARQPVLERYVAVKWIAFDQFAEQSLHRLDVEVAALVQLEHPGIVRLMDVVRDADGVWLVMEYVSGPTLRTVLDMRPAGLAPADAMAILEGLSAALDHVSRRGIVHRDVKPGNVFLTVDGRCKLADFGIASLSPTTEGAVSDPGRLTRPGTVLGTPAYMSPEQAGGLVGLDATTDVYSLGVVAYQLLVGRVPFPFRGNLLAVLAAHAAVPPPRPRSVRPELTGPVEDALLGALEKDPRRRPASAAAFWEDLERAGSKAWPRWRSDADLGTLARQHRVASLAPGTGAPRTDAAARPVPSGTVEEMATTEAVAEIGTQAAASAGSSQASRPPAASTTLQRRSAASEPSSVGEASVPKAVRRSDRAVRRHWLVVGVAFVVAGAGGFLAVRAATGQPGPGLGVVSMTLGLEHASSGLGCTNKSIRVFARITTNGAAGELRYRWATPGGALTPPATATARHGQHTLVETLRIAIGESSATGRGSVTFELSVPAPARHESLPLPAGC